MTSSGGVRGVSQVGFELKFHYNTSYLLNILSREEGIKHKNSFHTALLIRKSKTCNTLHVPNVFLHLH